jgi:UDP-glucuronate 4-epimerase
MRYLVTGAAGFIGSHLVEALLARGDGVVGLDCFSDYYDPALKANNARRLRIELRHLDLAEDDFSFNGFDGVFHLAGQPGVRSFGDVFPIYVRQNVVASQRVFEAAVSAGVKVVFASSSSVYGDAEHYPTSEATQPRPLSPYGITKLSCEHLARAYERSFGLDVVGLRYFTVYGPRQRPDMSFTRLFQALRDGTPFEVYGDGSQSRGFTFVSDAVEATIASMVGGRGIYNVGGGSEAAMLDVIQLAEEVSGRTLDLRFRNGVAGDVKRTSADITRIRADLGWQPQVGLEVGMREHWQWALEGAQALGTIPGR